MKKSYPKVSRALAEYRAARDRFAAARDGVVLVMTALMMMMLCVAAGLVIDAGRAYLVKQRLMNTTDAAGLAIGSAIDADSTNAELQAVLDNFFNANFPSGGIGTVTSTAFTYNGSTITVTAEVSVDTTFMQLVNIDNLSVSASTEVEREEDNLEVVLVLDNTGSMGSGGKMNDLKDAADSLVDVLFGSDAISSQVKIGLVPFSATVNIGTSNTTYISDDTDWNGCVRALDEPDDTDDNSSGPWDPHVSTSFFNPNRGCPSELTPLTNVKSTLTDAIDDMSADGFTYIHYGAIWGLRVLSQAEPFTEGSAYGTADTTKAIIILTDGANVSSTSNSAYQAYGDPPSSSDLDDKLETVCDEIKGEDIVVYTVTFDLNDASTKTLFENCATDSDKYFDSPAGSELTRSFRSIAAQLKRLHVSS